MIREGSTPSLPNDKNCSKEYPVLYLITRPLIDWMVISSVLSLKKLDRQNYQSSEEAAYLAAIDVTAKDSLHALSLSNRLNCLHYTFVLVGKNLDCLLSELGTSGLGFFVNDIDKLFLYGSLDKIRDLVIRLCKPHTSFLLRYVGNIIYLKLMVLKLDDIFTNYLTKERLYDGTFILKSR